MGDLMRKNLLTLALPLLLISCIEVRDANEEKDVPNVESAPVAEVRALAQPHRYAVVINGAGTMSKIFRKPISFLNQSPIVQITQTEDVVDKPGLYEYSVQQGSKYYQLRVEIPEDYVVEGNMQIEQLGLNLKKESDDYKVFESSGRLFFKAGSSLTTHGENFLIKVAMVDSEGAVIQTFPPNQKAKVGSLSRHGGNIRIEAQSLRGTLHAIMRGENGSDGERLMTGNGKPLNQLDNNGRNGGNSGFLEIAIQDKSKGDITFDLLPGAGGAGVEIIVFCMAQPCPDRVHKPKGKDGVAGVAQQPKI